MAMMSTSSVAPKLSISKDEKPSAEGFSLAAITVPEFVSVDKTIPIYRQIWRDVRDWKTQSDKDLGEAAWIDGEILQQLKPLPGTGGDKKVPHGYWGKFLRDNGIEDNYALLCRKIRVGFSRERARETGYRAMEISIWPSRGLLASEFEKWLISEEGTADANDQFDPPERSKIPPIETKRSRQLRSSKAINNDKVQPEIYRVMETLTRILMFMTSRAAQKHGLSWNPDKKVPRDKQGDEYDRMIKAVQKIAENANDILKSLQAAKSKVGTEAGK